jgi:uncharacterized membrane protein
MSRIPSRAIPTLVALSLGVSLLPTRADEPKAATEKEKIESLIKAVEGMKDAKFVRNGTAYDGKAAADHMRRKWKKVEKEAMTAQDFIRLAGTKSYETGQVYTVRFKDGKEVESAKWLTEKLEEIEKGKGG